MSLTLVRQRRRTAVPAPAPDAAGTTSRPRPRRSVALLVFVLGVLSAIGPLATDLYLPAFPQIAADLNAPESQIQLTLTAVMVGLAVGQLVIGPMSDAWGRRVPLLVGVTLFTATSFLCMLAPSAGALSLIRLVQGLAAGAGVVIARAVVRDTFDGDSAARFFSRLVLLVGLAPMLGPILGGQLMLVGSWKLIFAVLGVAGLDSLALVYFALPESLPPERRRKEQPVVMLATFLRLLRTPSFIAPAMTMALSFAMTFTYISAFSFVSQSEFGASAQQFSLIFGLNTIGMILGNQLNAALIGRMHTNRRLLLGLFGSVASVGVLAALGATGGASLVSVTAALFVMMFCTGLVSPNATTLAIAGQPASVAGTGSALVGTLQFAIGGTLAATAGLTATGEATLASMTAVMLATGLAATAVFIGGARATRRVAA